MKARRASARTYVIVGLLVALVMVSGYSVLRGSSPVNKGPVTSGLKVYLDYLNGSKVLLPSNGPTLSVTSGGGGGGTGLTFQPTGSISFSGDTITAASCSGTVSFSNTGSASVASQSTSGSEGASSSPASPPLSSVSVPFSDFSTEPSGTYTLTATLALSCSVTFTNGGPDSGVPFAATPVSASASYTVSNGVVTGVSSSI